MAEDLLERPLLHNSSGSVHLTSIEKNELVDYLSDLECEGGLIYRFLSAPQHIAAMDLCLALRISAVEEGVAIGVRAEGNLVSVPFMIGTPERSREARGRSLRPF